MVTMMGTLYVDPELIHSLIHHQVLGRLSQRQTKKHLRLKLGALISVHKLTLSLSQ